MYAKNVTTFVVHLMKDKQLVVALDDEITRETLVSRDGQVVHERLKQLASK
jgi:NAD/NADP transhydrogenase alpha subunit